MSCSCRSDRAGRDGELRLRFEQRRGRTVLAGCRFALPLQVLAPLDLEDPAAVVSILNPTGGLVGGDRLTIDVVAGRDTRVCPTTPSATRVYRTGGETSVQDVAIRVEAGATLEWVPDHTIPHAGSAFRQAIRVEIGEGARLILVDAFAAGRVARREAWQFAHLESSLAIRDPAGWMLRDRFVLRGDARWAAPGLAEGFPYFASVVAIGDGAAPALVEEVSDRLGPAPDLSVAGGPLARGGAIIRCLAAGAPALVDALAVIWGAARRHVLGAPPLALRKL